jgi:hypothetical protein
MFEFLVFCRVKSANPDMSGLWVRCPSGGIDFPNNTLYVSFFITFYSWFLSNIKIGCSKAEVPYVLLIFKILETFNF